MYRIRRFGVLKTATIAAFMYVVATLIFVAIAAVFVALVGPTSSFTGGVGTLLVGGLFAAAVYGVLGFIITAIACAIYNLVAGWLGGIEVQVEQLNPPAPPPVWGPITAPPADPPPSSQLPA